MVQTVFNKAFISATVITSSRPTTGGAGSNFAFLKFYELLFI